MTHVSNKQTIFSLRCDGAKESTQRERKKHICDEGTSLNNLRERDAKSQRIALDHSPTGFHESVRTFL